MNITIIGAGNVGRALGSVWLKVGHKIVFGVRDPMAGKVKTLLRTCGANASARKVRSSTAEADVVVLATPWQMTEAVLAGTDGLAGKVVIDCTNPLREGTEGLELAVGFDVSGGELVQSWLPEARIVKAFNQTGYDNIADASYPNGRPVMLYCGDDPDAKQVCHELITEVGFEAVDAGGLEAARLLEPYGMLWIQLALKQRLGRHFAYALLRRRRVVHSTASAPSASKGSARTQTFHHVAAREAEKPTAVASRRAPGTAGS